MSRLALALAAALGLACGSIEGVPLPAPLGPPTLSPDPVLADEAQDAVNAWAAATGIEIAIGSGGVPVRLSDDIDMCGLTSVLRRAIDGALTEIRSIEIWGTLPEGKYCRPRAATLRHELGHAIQQWAINTFPHDDGHASEGLLAPRANASHTIDEAALEKVCGVADCAWMSVEAAP